MNYVFFIGGSGARAYTAFLHACAAGVVLADEVKVMLLDADPQNAACENSCKLFHAYSEHRKMLGGGQNAGAAFHCNVQMYQEAAISPVHKDITHLGQVTGGNSVRDRALKWFYTKEEIHQDLSKGFYAHPNIGCMFFQDFGRNSQLDRCMQDIIRDLSENEARVVIVGSVFGGTGAAGIPSILKILEEQCCAAEVPPGKLHCSGVLIAPYFKVAEAPSSDGLTINSDEFYGSTKAALAYYRFIDRFEKTYLVGQKTMDLVNERYADGGPEQDNKPHIVEISAAMAVKDFLEGSLGDRMILGQIIDRENDDEQITWDSFGKDMYNLADMLRTQMVLETAIYPCTLQRPDIPRGGTYQWCRIYCTDSATSQKQLTVMQEYSIFFFEWLYPLQCRYAGAPSKLTLDHGIKLCKPEILEQLWSRIEARKNSDEGSLPGYKARGWRQYQEDFINLVETAEKIEYVVEKVGVLLSALGVLSKPVAAFNCASLFLKLCSLSKRAQRRAAS